MRGQALSPANPPPGMCPVLPRKHLHEHTGRTGTKTDRISRVRGTQKRARGTAHSKPVYADVIEVTASARAGCQARSACAVPVFLLAVSPRRAVCRQPEYKDFPGLSKLTQGCQAQHDEGGACHGGGDQMCAVTGGWRRGMNLVAGWGKALLVGEMRQRAGLYRRVSSDPSKSDPVVNQPQASAQLRERRSRRCHTAKYCMFCTQQPHPVPVAAVRSFAAHPCGGGTQMRCRRKHLQERGKGGVKEEV